MFSKKKLSMYVIIFVLLFQESFRRLFHIQLIDYIDEIIVLFFSLIAFIYIIKKKVINRRTLILLVLLFGFFISGSLSLFYNSSYIFSRYIASVFLSTKCFLLIIDISIIGFKNETKIDFINVVNNIGLLCVIIGVFNFVFPNIYHKIFTFANMSYRFGFISVTSLFYHTGRFGWFMLFLSLMNYVLYVNNNLNKNKYLFLIFGLCSLLSFRTKVLFSIIIILVINLFLFNKINIKKIVITGLIGIVIFSLFNEIILNTYYLYFDENNTTISARQSLNDNSIKILKDYFPLGVGFGKFGSWYARIYYSEYYYKYKMTNVFGLSPDNAFFGTDTFWSSILAETGFLGSLFYISFLLYIFLYFKKNIKIDANINSISVYFGELILVQSIVESFGEQSFNSPPQYIFLAFIVGNALYCLNNKVVNKIENKNSYCND